MAKRKARKPSDIPADETKEARFMRVVKPRIVKAAKAIRLVGHCAGVGYVYTPEQVQQIREALTTALENTLLKFETKAAADTGFDFTS